MEQQVKTIRIKEGKVLVSPMVQLPEPLFKQHGDKIKAFEASFYPVENPEEVLSHLQCGYSRGRNDDGCSRKKCLSVDGKCPLWIKKSAMEWDDESEPSNEIIPIKDGDYPAPEGLTMEVKHLCPNEDSFCDVCNCKQVAVVTFSEPKEAEKEEKPDFEIIDNAETTGEVIITWKTDVGKLKEANIQLQQEITTLRARIAELEKK